MNDLPTIIEGAWLSPPVLMVTEPDAPDSYSIRSYDDFRAFLDRAEAAGLRLGGFVHATEAPDA